MTFSGVWEDTFQQHRLAREWLKRLGTETCSGGGSGGGERTISGHKQPSPTTKQRKNVRSKSRLMTRWHKAQTKTSQLKPRLKTKGRHISIMLQRKKNLSFSQGRKGKFARLSIADWMMQFFFVTYAEQVFKKKRRKNHWVRLLVENLSDLSD